MLVALDIDAGTKNPSTQVTVDFWDDQENPYSTALAFVCWTRIPLVDIDPFFEAAFLGRPYGSLWLTPEDTCFIPGLCPFLAPFYRPAILGVLLEHHGAPAAATTGRLLSHDNVPHPTLYTAE